MIRNLNIQKKQQIKFIYDWIDELINDIENFDIDNDHKYTKHGKQLKKLYEQIQNDTFRYKIYQIYKIDARHKYIDLINKEIRGKYLLCIKENKYEITNGVFSGCYVRIKYVYYNTHFYCFPYKNKYAIKIQLVVKY